MDPNDPNAPHTASESSEEESPRVGGPAQGSQVNDPAQSSRGQRETNVPPPNTSRSGDPDPASGGSTRNPITTAAGSGGSGPTNHSNLGSNQLNEMQKMLAEMIKRSEAQEIMMRDLATRQEQYDRRLSEISNPLMSSGARTTRRVGAATAGLNPTRLRFTPPSQHRRQTPPGNRSVVFTQPGSTTTRGPDTGIGVRVNRHDDINHPETTAEAPPPEGGSRRQEARTNQGPTASFEDPDNPLENDDEFRAPSPIPEYFQDDDQTDLRRYLENQSAELRRMSSELHKATSSAPEIDRLIEETRQTPFTNKVAYARIKNSRKYRFPQYDGKGDPKDFIKAFRLAMQTQVTLTEEEEDPAYCRFFAENLTGPALEWFMGMDGGSIDDFEQLIKAFIRQFSVLVKEVVSEADFWKISQKSGEPLRTYVEKFKAIRTKISNVNHKIAIDALKAGLAPHSLLGQELVVRPVYTIDDALHTASKFIVYEELETLKATDPRFQKSDPQGSRNQGRKPAPRDNKTQGEHACAVNDTRQKQTQPKDAKSRQENSASGVPNGLQNTKYRPYDPNKYCKHHERAGHSTEECAEVKKQLAAKFAAGELKSVELSKRPPFRKKQPEEGQPSQKRDRSPPKETDSPPPAQAERPRRRIEAIFRDMDISSGKVLSLTPPPGPKKRPAPLWRLPRICGGEPDVASGAVNFIFGGSELCGTSVNSVKTNLRRVKSDLRERTPLQGPDTKISFWESETEGLDRPHDDALIIELIVAGCELTKMLVDTGSSVDLIFFNALKAMKIDLREIKGDRVTLYGFSGETTLSMGTIELPVIAEGVEKMINFTVVDRRAPFLAILGRPWLHKMRAVSSTYHQCVKFPTPKGIASIKGSQNVSRICYADGFQVIKESGE